MIDCIPLLESQSKLLSFVGIVSNLLGVFMDLLYTEKLPVAICQGSGMIGPQPETHRF